MTEQNQPQNYEARLWCQKNPNHSQPKSKSKFTVLAISSDAAEIEALKKIQKSPRRYLCDICGNPLTYTIAEPPQSRS